MGNASEGSGSRVKKACCLVSEMLEEMGLDAPRAREIRRQTLLGLMTFCQWQLARLDDQIDKAARESKSPEPPKGRPARGRRVRVV